jgi:hypothetical protein
MHHPDILMGLLQSHNPSDVAEQIEKISERLGNSFRILPIGGSPGTSWDAQGQPNFTNDWNNRFHGLAVGNPDVALYERIKNCDDAVTKLFEKLGLFQGTPTTVAEANAEVAAQTPPNSARVYLLSTEEQPNGCRTATVIDQGIGISPNEFATGICGRGSISKVGDPLQTGNLGFGASTSLRHCEYTIIVSRTYDFPNLIAFTVAHTWQHPLLGSCFVWYCDEYGNAFTALAQDLDEKRVVAPDEINSKNVHELVRNLPQTGRVFLPRHGTAVRMVGFTELHSKNTTYHMMREIAFGVEVPHCLINGLSKQRTDEEDETDDAGAPDKKNSDVRYSIGMRHILNGQRARNVYPVRHHQPPVVQELKGFGEVTLEAWICDSRTGRLPLDGMKLSNPILVTLNGQVHSELPGKVLLGNVDMLSLHGSLLIEIALDRLSDDVRDRIIKSDRKGTVKIAIEMIKALIARFIRKDESFIALNQEFRERLVLRNGEARSTAGIGRVNRLLANPMAGPIFSNFGGAGYGRQTTDNTTRDANGTGNDYRKQRHIETREPPSYIKLRKGSIKAGHDEYFAIETDAPNRYNGRIVLEVQTSDGFQPLSYGGSFLTEVGKSRKGLQNGRDSFLVACGKDALIGMTANVRANLVLFDNAMLVSRAEQIEVVAAVEEKPRRNVRPSQPHIETVRLRPEDKARWVAMDGNGIAPEKIAFNYRRDGEGRWLCFVNLAFERFVRMREELRQHGYSKPVLEQFEDDYVFHAELSTLHYLEAEIDAEVEDSERMLFHKQKAVTLAQSLTVRYLEIVGEESRRKAA